MTRIQIPGRIALAKRALELKRTGMSYVKIGTLLKVTGRTVANLIHEQAEQKPLDKCEKCNTTQNLHRHTNYETLETTILCKKCHANVHSRKGKRFVSKFVNGHHDSTGLLAQRRNPDPQAEPPFIAARKAGR